MIIPLNLLWLLETRLVVNVDVSMLCVVDTVLPRMS